MWVCIRRAQNKRLFIDIGFVAPMSECYLRPYYGIMNFFELSFRITSKLCQDPQIVFPCIVVPSFTTSVLLFSFLKGSCLILSLITIM